MEYLQTWEKDGKEMTLYFDFSSDRYVVMGYGMKTLCFTDIYDANNYMTDHGWR